MSKFIPWNSQPHEEWRKKYAKGAFIDLNGRKTHYLEKGDGPPLILLHGFNFDSYTWVANIDALAAEFKVYAPDHWGHGYSTRDRLDYGYPLYVEQLRRFMDALNIEKASLAGHSMGGGTAMFFALNNRTRVEKLVLVDATGYPQALPLRGKIFQLPYFSEFLLDLKSDAVRRKNIGDFWIYNKDLITNEYFEEATRFQKIKRTTEILLEILRKNFFFTLEDEIRQLGQMDIPALVILGRMDTTVHLETAKATHELLKGSRFEILDKAGHMSNYDQAEIFNSLVLEG